MTDTADLTTGAPTARLVAAVRAALPLVPSVAPLTVGDPRPAGAVDPTGWAAGAVADLTGTGGVVAVLVRADLVQALASAPDGALDLGAALQPALDAAGATLGDVVGPARTLPAAELAALMSQTEVAVPLQSGETVTGVVLFRAVVPEPAAAPPQRAPGAAPSRGVELLHGVAMEVTVELGRTRLAVRDLLALAPGDVLELDRTAGSPADLLVNGRLIARGEVVVVDENFALRVTEIVAPSAGV